ncbi:MAG: thiol peroxidase [Desulfobacterales bacterium]|nr:thiol peroxidase [Desulfobacterales bacterium]
MNERQGLITMKGNPFTLIGNVPKIGELAPDFEVINNELQPVKLSSFKGKVCIISSVPSLDTPVCNMQTRRFNKEAVSLSSDTLILTISMDLPFAQVRWCGSSGVDKVITLSDYKNAEFGINYGILIKELRLLARAVYIVDKEGILRFEHLVKEIANEPGYDEILKAVNQLK